MNTLWQDLRYGLRILFRSPGFTAVAILTLALGIGVNTAIFSLLNQVLLQSLPVRQPEQLVVLQSPGPKQGQVSSDTSDGAQSFSYLMYKDLRDQNQVFSGLLARYPVSLNVAVQGQTERASGELVSGNYFDVLGVQAALGRTFLPEDDVTPGAHPIAILSHGFWVRRFAADQRVLNQTMAINGQVMTVVGVTQPGFIGVQVGQTPDIFIPITMKAQMTPNWDGLDNRKDYWLSIIGRMTPELNRQQAEAGLQPLYRSLVENEVPLQGPLPARDKEQFVNRPLELLDGSQGRQILQVEARDSLLMLMGMVGLVLLITCANLASLLVTRGVARRKEIAVRQALGASRWRLVRQLLVESVALSLTGGLLGLLVAWWSLAGLLQWMPQGEGLGGLSTELDAGMLAFNFSLSVLAGILFGLMPALKATGTKTMAAIKEQGRSTSAGVAHAGVRKGLVIAEVALTMVVLVAAGLFARSLYNLKRVDLGIRPERLIRFSIAPELNGYTSSRSKALYQELQTSLAALPGIEAVSGAEVPIFSGSSSGSNITVEGYATAEGEDTHAFRNHVMPDYFSTVGVPLVAGREFTAQDSAKSQKVAIISESLAQRYLGDTNPIGRRMKFGAGNSPLDMEIVGVVRGSKHGTVRDDFEQYVYVPYTQRSSVGQMTFYVRTAQPPETMAAALRQEVAHHDANLPVFHLRTLEEQIDQSLTNDRFVTMLSSAFGLLAAGLAVLGIYGVMSYTVRQRTHEIGIRMALGAEPGHVLRLILKQGMWLALTGVAIGAIASFAGMRLLKSLLYDVSTTDAQIFIGVSTLLIVVALFACYVPARRATKVDPMVALRYE